MADRVYKRRGDIELLRFIAAVAIMLYHSKFYLDLPRLRLGGGWIFVEFFFMLTGYFTARHFIEKDNTVSPWAYTLKRFKKIFIYFSIALAAIYSIEFLHLIFISEKISALKLTAVFPLELCYLSPLGLFDVQLGNAWYLAAMFWSLPLVCYLLIKKKSFTLQFLSWTVPFLFYGFVGIHIRTQAGIIDILRGFSCILLGVFVYNVCGYIKSFTEKHIMPFFLRLAVSIFEILILSAAIVFMKGDTLEPQNIGAAFLLLFFLLILMLSDVDLFYKAHGTVLNFLGEVSLPMYLFSKVVGKLLVYLDLFSDQVNFVLYFVVCFALSCFAVALSYILKKRKLQRRLQN